MGATPNRPTTEDDSSNPQIFIRSANRGQHPDLPPIYGPQIQIAECVIGNDDVAGAIPAWTSTFADVAKPELAEGAVLETENLEGAIPSFGTNLRPDR